MRGAGLLVSLVLAGCGSSSSPEAPADAAPSPDDGPAGCALAQSLVNDAQEIMAQCPGTAIPSIEGSAIADGTYELTQTVAYASACGALASYPIHATVRVQGDTLALVWDGPAGLGCGHQTVRASYRFVVAGVFLQLTPLCPGDGSASASVEFSSDSVHLRLFELPPGTSFDSFLDRR